MRFIQQAPGFWHSLFWVLAMFWATVCSFGHNSSHMPQCRGKQIWQASFDKVFLAISICQPAAAAVKNAPEFRPCLNKAL